MYKKFITWFLVIVSGTISLSTAVQAADKTVDLKTFSLIPAAEPVPALSYKLLPSNVDQKTGNAALLLYSAAALCPDGDTDNLSERIDKWRSTPLDQLNRKEAEEALSPFSNCFHQVKLASQRNYCRWEMPVEDGYNMQMPSLATFRRMILAMQLQIRLYIAEGKTEQALEMMRQGMYMGRCVAEGPTIVQSLVGIAIEATILKEVEEITQMENCPNLYWALTSLPNPLVDMHSSIQFEREAIFVEFPQLKDLENKSLTPEQALEIVNDFINKIQSLGGSETSDVPINKLISAGWVMAHYSDAKKYLADKGYSKERIESMPAVQAVLIFQKQQYMEVTDNMFKWLEIPYYRSEPYLQKSEEQLSNFTNQGLKTNLFTILTPALYRISFLQARLDRNVAMLRTIEAIRMYAAAHSGKLPESLSDITSVPIPFDPVTGKDFIYSRIDVKNARLEAPKAPAESQNRPVYELNIK
jgi:hypothetical protein